MEFKGRALYNLLTISSKEDISLQVEPWQVLNYRSLSDEVLLKKLFALNLPLTKDNFVLYADSCNSPEELVECLWIQESDIKGHEQAYLVIFELWRRLLPNRQSLSIFCDELDALISLFDEGEDIDDEVWQKVLSELGDILDKNTEMGNNPKEVFASISQYMAHNIETFLYDFIFELLEKENEVLATSLIESFIDYVGEKKWLHLLRANLLFSSNIQAWKGLVHRLLEEEEENPSLSFLMEVLTFLTISDDSSLVSQCIKQILPLIETEEEKEELFSLMLEFCKNSNKESALNILNRISDKKALEDVLLAL